MFIFSKLVLTKSLANEDIDLFQDPEIYEELLESVDQVKSKH